MGRVGRTRWMQHAPKDPALSSFHSATLSRLPRCSYLLPHGCKMAAPTPDAVSWSRARSSRKAQGPRLFLQDLTLYSKREALPGLTSSWPELGHVATPGCKGSLECRLICLRKAEGRGFMKGFYPSATSCCQKVTIQCFQASMCIYIMIAYL